LVIHAIDCRVWSDSGVLIVHVLGILTLASIASIRRLTLEGMQPDTRAVVVDLRKCVSAITPEGWARVANDAVVRTPMAIVCSEPQLHIGTSHVAMMRDRGFNRLVFSELVDAFEWALKTARLAASPQPNQQPSRRRCGGR
jgi:hypothetical protein